MALPKFKTPRLLTGSKLWAYLLTFGTPTGSACFVRLTRPLHVFKKAKALDEAGAVFGDCIVNLEIPAGARVYADTYRLKHDSIWETDGQRKMRADKALVHSIICCRDDDYGPLSPRSRLCKPIGRAASMYDRSFEYKCDATVRPKGGFDSFPDTCSRGIHFFINLRDALDY